MLSSLGLNPSLASREKSRQKLRRQKERVLKYFLPLRYSDVSVVNSRKSTLCKAS